MGGGEGSKGNLKEDLEQVGGSLEPDPRYMRCCSTVCRPGYALRDALLGLLVLLALSVIVTVIFVVCFYVVPDEKQLIEDGLIANAEGVIGDGLRIDEPANEVSLQNVDKYNVDDQDSLDYGFNETPNENIEEEVSNIPDEYESYIPNQFGDEGRPVEGRDNFDGPPLAEIQEGERAHEENLFGHKRERPQYLPEEEVKAEVIETRVEPGKPEVTGYTCSPVMLPMCVSTVPWSMASKPNWLNHTGDGDMFAYLPYIRSALIDSGCSALSPLYACTILEPPCVAEEVLPPCRSFCRGVAEACHTAVQGLTLPGLFDCDRFPDSQDPDVCVSAKQGIIGPGKISPYDYNEYGDNEPTANRKVTIFGEVIQKESSTRGADNPHFNIGNDLSLNHELVEHTPPPRSEQNSEHFPIPQDIPIVNELPPTSNNSLPDDQVRQQDGGHEEVFGEPEVELAVCTLDMFMCNDGSNCIANSSVCDGFQNCDDGSDEINCSGSSIECSGVDDFKCANTDLCVPKNWVCDGADDCGDNSDEQTCQRSSFTDTDSDVQGNYGQYQNSRVSENLDRPFDLSSIAPNPYPGSEYDTLVINDPTVAGPNIEFESEIKREDSTVNDEGNRNANEDSSRFSIRRPSGPNTRSKYHPTENVAATDNAPDRRRRPFPTRGKLDNEHVEGEQDHPLPGVETPAREAFSIDSSVVNENFPEVPVKVEEQVDYDNEHNEAFENNGQATRSPSQRIRDRFRGEIQGQRVSTQASSVPSTKIGNMPRGTRPPSRLENFQSRFQEYQAKRRPNVPDDLQHLVTSQGPSTTPPVGKRRTRPYELVRRRPQISSSVNEQETENVELLREENIQHTENIPETDVAQPVDLPQPVVPEHEYQAHNTDERTPLRRDQSFRLREGFRPRLASRRRNQQQQNLNSNTDATDSGDSQPEESVYSQQAERENNIPNQFRENSEIQNVQAPRFDYEETPVQNPGIHNEQITDPIVPPNYSPEYPNVPSHEYYSESEYGSDYAPDTEYNPDREYIAEREQPQFNLPNDFRVNFPPPRQVEQTSVIRAPGGGQFERQVPYDTFDSEGSQQYPIYRVPPHRQFDSFPSYAQR